MAADPRLMTVFGEALEYHDGNSLAAYLDNACGTDVDLRRRVEALLAAHVGAGRFLDAGTSSDATVTYSAGEGAFKRSNASHPVGQAAAGQVIAGRYTLLEVIGEGGMGTVYRADQGEPVKRQVALKLIRTGMDSKTVLARFEAERQALAMMDHPNIARVYDGGNTPAGQPFFVMELVNGVAITEYCDRHRFAVPARLELFVAVCHAVQHAHQKGVIHRDLKPSNVLVTEVDGRPTPKVIDFGVAKATEQKLTDRSFSDTGAIVGTPEYMSPEQADPSSMDIDTRTDVYALGVILYELLAGSPPIEARQFKRGAVLEMLRMVREVDPPRPSTKVTAADALPNVAANRHVEPAQLKRLLQGDLDWIVMKALEKDRTRRYETVNGLAADVLRHLAHEPVLAAPPSRLYRAHKFVRKNRRAVVAAGLVLLSLVGGIVGTSIGLVRAEAARKSEQSERERAETEKNNASDQRRLAEYRAASTAIDLDLEYCRRDNTGEGILRLARSLKRLPADAVALRQCVLLNILVWGQRISPLVVPSEAVGVAIAADNRTCLRQKMDGTAELWDLYAARRLAVLGTPGMQTHEMAFDPTGRRAATSSADTVRIWSTSNYRMQCEIRLAPGHFADMLFSPDGSRLLTAAEPGPGFSEGDPHARTLVELWDVDTGAPIARLEQKSTALTGWRFSPDCRTVLTAAGGVVRAWASASGAPLATLDHGTSTISRIAFCPSGRFVVTWADRFVQWWDSTTWTRVGPPCALSITGQSSDPDEALRFDAFSDDAAYAANWNLHGGGRRIGSALCLRGEVTPVDIDAFMADGQYALTTDGRVYSLRPFRKLDEAAGSKFPAEVLELSEGRRFLRCSNYLFDLVAEKPIGPSLFERGVIAEGPYRFQSDSRFTTANTIRHYLSPDHMLVPSAEITIDADVLELWAQVVARGELAPETGVHRPLDEPTWERRRQLLLARAPAVGDFPFPGAPATDGLYWLRQEVALKRSERKPAGPLLDRLIDTEPNWQNFKARAEERSGGDPAGALRDFLKAIELGLAERDTYVTDLGLSEVENLVSRRGLARAEYELALHWFDIAAANPRLSVFGRRLHIAKGLVLYRLERFADAIHELLWFDRNAAGVVVAAFAVPLVLIDPELIETGPAPDVAIALCRLHLGQPELARRHLTRAIDLERARRLRDSDSVRALSEDWKYSGIVEEALKAIPRGSDDAPKTAK